LITHNDFPSPASKKEYSKTLIPVNVNVFINHKIKPVE